LAAVKAQGDADGSEARADAPHIRWEICGGHLVGLLGWMPTVLLGCR
jgi:hypothetical protein